MKTEFPRAYLAAVSILAANKDIRYYLLGVLVEALPNETRLAATDGNVLGAMRVNVENAAPFEVIVPSSVIALAVKLPHEVLSVERNEAGAWSISGIPFVPVDGKFPAYRRVIPAETSGHAGDFDPDLIARFAKVGKALKIKSVPIIRQNGAQSALVHFYNFDDFVGVLMPMRLFTEKHPDLGRPTWGPVYA